MAPNVYALSVFILFVLLQLFVQSHATFEFIKSLEGSQKGEKVEGLHKLKKFLEHFGYLSHYYKDAALHNSNDFDDVLESAIKTYQLNFNLNVTGTLNAETVALMAAPRCGVPDIINGMNSMRSGRSAKKTTTMSDGHQNKLMAHTISHYKINNGRRRWRNTDLTYAFNSKYTPAEARDPIISAFKQWADGTNRFTFKSAPSISRSNIKIEFRSGDHGDGEPFDGPGRTIAHAAYPTVGLMHFDNDEKWSVKPTPDAFVYETIALHEIGHILGLNHSSVRAAALYPYNSHGEVKTLQKDDLDGIKDLYR